MERGVRADRAERLSGRQAYVQQADFFVDMMKLGAHACLLVVPAIRHDCPRLRCTASALWPPASMPLERPVLPFDHRGCKLKHVCYACLTPGYGSLNNMVYKV